MEPSEVVDLDDPGLASDIADLEEALGVAPHPGDLNEVRDLYVRIAAHLERLGSPRQAKVFDEAAKARGA